MGQFTRLVPELSEAEYQRLKESIRERGVLVPIEVDADTGEVLDGAHRLRACEELGIDPPIVERYFESDAERTIHALTLNLARRQLGPLSWAKAFEALLKARGVETTRGPKEQDGNSLTVSEIAGEAGVSPATARNRLKLARDLEPYPETAAKVDAGRVTVKDAMIEAAKEAEEKGIAPPVIPPKKLPEGVKAGFDSIKRYRHLVQFDPAEVASAHSNRYEPTAVQEEIERTEEVIDWLNAYMDALKQNTGLRAIK